MAENNFLVARSQAPASLPLS